MNPNLRNLELYDLWQMKYILSIHTALWVRVPTWMVFIVWNFHSGKISQNTQNEFKANVTKINTSPTSSLQWARDRQWLEDTDQVPLQQKCLPSSLSYFRWSINVHKLPVIHVHGVYLLRGSIKIHLTLSSISELSEVLLTWLFLVCLLKTFTVIEFAFPEIS